MPYQSFTSHFSLCNLLMSIIPCDRRFYILTSHIRLVPAYRDGYNGCCIPPKQNKAKQKNHTTSCQCQPTVQTGTARSLEVPCWLTYFMTNCTYSYKNSHLGFNKALNSPLGQHEDTHTFYFGGLLLHVLGMSLAQVVRCRHGRRGEGHVADGTTLVPVLPIAAFLLAVLCTEKH